MGPEGSVSGEALEPKTSKGRLAKVAFAAVASAAIAAALIGGGLAVLHSQGAAPATVETSSVPASTVAAIATALAPSLTTRQIGDWAVICPTPTSPVQGCFIQQQLRTRDQKQIVVAWTIRTDAAGVHAVWEVPADVVRERGLVLDLGDGKPKGLPFSGCTKQTCTAKALLAPDFVQSIGSATSIAAAVSAPGRDTPIRFGLSARGFVEALAQLSVPSAAGG